MGHQAVFETSIVRKVGRRMRGEGEGVQVGRGPIWHWENESEF